MTWWQWTLLAILAAAAAVYAYVTVMVVNVLRDRRLHSKDRA